MPTIRLGPSPGGLPPQRSIVPLVGGNANVTVSAALMTATAALDAPTLNLQATPPVMTATAALDANTVNISTPTAALLTATALLYTPTTNEQLAAALMTATALLYAPVVSYQVTGPALMTATALLYAPGPPNIGYTAALMTATAALDAITLNEQLAAVLATASVAMLAASGVGLHITGFAVLTATASMPVVYWILVPLGGGGHTIRVDVYGPGANPSRLGVGPITQVIGDLEYGDAVDRIGDAKIVFPATDPKVADITDLGQLRIYRGGEGRVFVGRVREILTGQDATGAATCEVILDDLAIDLAVAKTGIGLVLSDVSPAGMLSAILAAANAQLGSNFVSGSVDSSSVTLRKRHDADGAWPAIIADAPVWSMHARHDSITDPTAPAVDVGAFGADSGLIFGLGGYPLQEVRKHRAGSGIVNRVIGFGQGEGYPALSLAAASHGANIATDPGFEAGTTAGISGSGVRCTPAQSSTVAKSGTYSCRLTWASGTDFYWTGYTTISGATAGRVYSWGVWVIGTGATIGKTAYIRMAENGGAFGAQQSTPVTVVLTAAWQYVGTSYTLIRNDRTIVGVEVGIQSGAASGDVMYVDRLTFWESTNAAYCVETDLNPDGSSRYWIEDCASSSVYGVREDYRTVKAAYPTAATKAGWVGACDQVYDLCAEWLQLHTAALSTYSAKVLGLDHVYGGAQQLKVGDKGKLYFHGATADGAWLTVEALQWIMAYRRRVGAGGTNETDLTLSSVDLHYLDAFARLAAQMQEYKGSGTELKQSNYVFSIPIPRYTLPSAVSTREFTFSLSNVLAVTKATVTYTVVSGPGTAVIKTNIFPGVGAGTVLIATRTPTVGTVYVDDFTSSIVQAPTPVPVDGGGPPAYWGGSLEWSSGAGANSVIEGFVTIECSKIPLPPA